MEQTDQQVAEVAEVKLETILSKQSQKIYEDIFQMLKESKFKTYMEIITIAMEMIEKIEKMEKSKFETLLEILKELIQFAPLVLPEPQKTNMMPMLMDIKSLIENNLLKSVIDGLIFASKGLIKVNIEKPKWCKCF